MGKSSLISWVYLSLLAGVLGFLSSQIFPPFVYMEHKLYDIRSIFHPADPIEDQIVLLQITPQEHLSLINYLGSMPKDELKVLGLDTPHLFESQRLPQLHQSLNDKVFPVVNSSSFLPAKAPHQHYIHHRTLSSAKEGHINYFPDKDGVLRDYPSAISVNNPKEKKVWPFSNQIYHSLSEKHSLLSGQIVYPRTPAHIYTLSDIKRLSLKNKILIVSDRTQSYLSSTYHSISALEIYGLTLSNQLLQYQIISSVWLNLGAAAIFGLLLGSSLLIAHALGKWAGAGGILVLYFSYMTLNVFLFQSMGLWLNMITPCLIPIFSLLFLFPLKDQLAISHTIKPHVRPLSKNHLTESVIQNERKQITIMFTDIQGFTKMGENLPPDHVMGLLNEYLSEMSDIIFENHGNLDKYIGDGIMAVYGNIGKNQPSKDAYNAVKTALEMQKKMENLQRTWMTKKRKPFRIRIGIHSGEAVVGYVGHPAHKEITVIGDTVNTAAHLEKLSRAYPSQLLISQTTYQYVKDLIDVIDRGPHEIKGKTKHVKVYEVKGWKQ